MSIMPLSSQAKLETIELSSSEQTSFERVLVGSARRLHAANALQEASDATDMLQIIVSALAQRRGKRNKTCPKTLLLHGKIRRLLTILVASHLDMHMCEVYLPTRSTNKPALRNLSDVSRRTYSQAPFQRVVPRAA